MWWLALPLAASGLAIIFAIFLIRWVLSQDNGTPEMRKVSDAIFTGAQAYLRRQYITIAGLAVVAALVIAALLAFLSSSDKATGDTPVTIAVKTAIAFAIGAFCSG